jgi:AcrR family transcriptional regulator
VTENGDLVIQSTAESAAARPGTDPRAERLLDAAAALLVQLGYRRVTIEDVASAAGIGKGTVYLHFPTKEALFLTVLLRGHRAVVGGMSQRMRADPREAMPGRMMASVYRRLARDPVARRIYLGDVETWGKLAQEAAGTLVELSKRREAVLAEHIRLLRGAGLLRADPDAVAQRYLLGAVASGFYLLDPTTMPSMPADPSTRADLLEFAISSVLEVPGQAPDQAIAVAVATQYESLIEHIDEEWRCRAR